MPSRFSNSLAEAIRPDPIMTYSEWADEYFHLPRESSAEYGRYRIDRTPFVKEILDELSPTSPTQVVVVVKPTQLAGTTIALIFICAMMDISPGPALFIGITDAKTKSFSKKKLTPAIKATDRLKDKIREPRAKDSGNTILMKEFPGGSLMLTGSNSGASYRSESIKYLILDDFDGFEMDIEGEGSPEKLADRRTGSFPNRKIYINSTTTLKDMSNIETAFEYSSQGYFNVPCPHCGHFQYLSWGGPDETYGIKFTRDENGIVTDAWYMCAACGERINESEKPKMISRGKYVHRYPERKTKGFRYNALVTPTGWVNDWIYIAQEYVEAKHELDRGNTAPMKTWMNSFMSLPWEEKGERPAWKILKKRAEDYDIMTVPQKAKLLTCGVDTQDNRLELVVTAWASFEESWTVMYDVLYGDPAEGEVFERLDRVLNYHFPREEAGYIMIMSLAIDAMGHRTQAVYNYARTRYPRVMAIQGSTSFYAPVLKPVPSLQDVTFRGDKIKKGVRLWTVGSSTGKQTIYSRLMLEAESGPGIMHFPKGLPDVFYKQLTAEKLVNTKDKKGRKKQEWIPIYDNNEVLDCSVYAYAAAIRCGVTMLTDEPDQKTKIEKEAKQSKAPIERILAARRSGFNRPDWLNR